MKLQSFGAALATMVAVASSASAGDFRIADPGAGYRTGNGGEFTVQHDTGGIGGTLTGWGQTGLVADRSAGSFQTFCIELNENVSLGTSYFGAINTAAWNGGVGGGNPDPISEATAWVYSSFRKGTLASYVYTPGAARATAARALQLAIWRLENEITDGNAEYSLNLQAQAWVAAANAWGLANPGNFLNVRALNVYADAGHTLNRQDMLTIIPLPTAGGMGMAGLLGVLVIRRRVRI